MNMPTDSQQRKLIRLATGVCDYFPDALVAVAEVSRVGNDQQNPGEPLHWDRSKSKDESDALMRHFLERGTLDADGVRHSAKVAWRALALLQKEIEAEREPQRYSPNGIIDLPDAGVAQRPSGSDQAPGRAVWGVQSPPGQRR